MSRNGDRARVHGAATRTWGAALLLVASAVAGVSCASGQDSTTGEGGGGPVTTSTNTSSSTDTSSSTTATTTTTSSTTGAGGAGGEGGALGSGGAGGAGGALGTGGQGGAGGSGQGGMGQGGAGNMWQPPVGSADYPAETEQNNLKQTANPLADGTKGFTASVYPLGDVDVFSVDVVQPGSSLRVEIGDGMGGCPAGAQTLLRVLGNGGALASDTDSGVDACSLLDPASHPELTGLAAGTYYVQVEANGANPIPFYVADIQLKAPGCSDGVVQVAAGEQCDDGNAIPGDGCDANCQLEGNFTTETEPNDTVATGNAIDGYDGVVASIQPAGDQDYFTFDVPVAGSSVSLLVHDGFGNCPGFDSKMTLYGPANNEIVTDDDDGPDSCSAISPQLDPGATNLPAGQYKVLVHDYGDNDAMPLYVLGVKVSAPGCGDSILQVGEQCDDGNKLPGDGCDANCQLEGNFTPETEPNDTIALANDLGNSDGFSASINPIGDLDYFKFQVTVPGSTVQAIVGDGVNGCPAGFDSKLTLFGPNNALLVSDDDGGADHCSAITPQTHAEATNLAVGTYTLRVEEYNNDALQPGYVLEIKVSPPGCGDSVLQAGEQCDDGNQTPGDGCDASCNAEAPWEIEPNDAIATATPQWPGTTQWRGAIAPVGDHDYYAFTVAQGAKVTLATHDVGNAATCGFDTKIYLVDGNGNSVASDDDGGVGTCSQIDPVAYPAVSNLAAGTYYVWVQRYSDSDVIASYQLDLTVQ